jgi:hypothetical protein
MPNNPEVDLLLSTVVKIIESRPSSLTGYGHELHLHTYAELKKIQNDPVESKKFFELDDRTKDVIVNLVADVAFAVDEIVG